MGTGKNGSFDKTPDLQQWAILTVEANLDAASAINDLDNCIQDYTKQRYGKWIAGWWMLFHCEVWSLLLDPIEGHGSWDGKQPFGQLAPNGPYEGPIAILTRATIKLNKLSSFWSNVGSVANKMSGAKGFIGSFGIGEVPWIKQATFSLWKSKADMKSFAYKMHEHAVVIQKTRKEQWYSEDLFMRFIPLGSIGSLKGIDLLERKP
jgi:hypothetical protein